MKAHATQSPHPTRGKASAPRNGNGANINALSPNSTRAPATSTSGAPSATSLSVTPPTTLTACSGVGRSNTHAKKMTYASSTTRAATVQGDFIRSILADRPRGSRRRPCRGDGSHALSGVADSPSLRSFCIIGPRRRGGVGALRGESPKALRALSPEPEDHR